MKLLSQLPCILLLVCSTLTVPAQDVLYGTNFGTLTEVQVGGDYSDGGVKNGYWTSYYTPWSPERKEEFSKKVEEKYEEDDFYLPDASDIYDAPEHSEAIEQDFKDRQLYLQQPVKHTGAYVNGKKDGMHKWYTTERTIVNRAIYDQDVQLLFEIYKKGNIDMKLETLGGGTQKKTFYYPNGNREQEFYYEGDFKTGPFKTFYESGQLKFDGSKRNNKTAGPYKIFFDTGILKEEGTRVNGKNDGLIIIYYSNGNVKLKQAYTVGKKNGRVTYYKESGAISGVQEWKNDVRWRIIDNYNPNGEQSMKDGHGIFITYYKDGTISSKAEMKNGMRDGVTTWYYNNGQVEQTALYKPDTNRNFQGLRWEILSSFTKDGTPREKGTLKDGNGTWVNFDADGIRSVTTYKNGVKVE